ncbi:MAG: hypothetical protein V3T72_17885 [Thermoanaerobaculia bacterium]
MALDYAAATGAPAAPLLNEILADAPADTEEQTLVIVAGIANGRLTGHRQRQALAAAALAVTVRRRRLTA